MEHGERIEGGDARESGEGAEEEIGAGSDEREAVAGSKRERGGLTGGIKKISRRRGHQGRGRRAHGLVNNGEMQKDRARHARHDGPALPFGERESELDCARAFRPRAPRP